MAVYGSLKQGFGNHDLLENAHWLGATWLDGLALYDLGAFPGARYAPDSRILAEVYDVDASTLETLDWLEGCDMEMPERSLYHRFPHDSEHGSVWVYIFQSELEESDRVESGNWASDE